MTNRYPSLLRSNCKQQRRTIHLVHHCLLLLLLQLAMTSSPSLAQAQESTENPNLPVIVVDDDALPEGNQTSLFPTIVDIETIQPTTKPTVSRSPSTHPTIAPTKTISPSNFPTTTFSPSFTPSISQEPSVSAAPTPKPSSAPTRTPSTSPTPAPSGTPTISSEPTISSQPTISTQPSLSIRPSDFPSKVPSESPSAAPTVSALPSFIPSESPSLSPSVSSAPSVSPSISQMPTITMIPSAVPSVSPSTLPSLRPTSPTSEPSKAPTGIPSIVPTGAPSISLPILHTGRVTQDKIVMVLRNIPAPLDVNGGQLWENITEHHILRFYAEIQDKVRGLLTFNVSNAFDTLIRKQTFTLFPTAGTTTTTNTDTDSATTLQQEEANDGVNIVESPPMPPTPSPRHLGQLELEYSQTLDYVLFVPLESVNEEVILRQIFVLPFENDAQAYLLDMVVAFDLDDWIELQDINTGPTPSPTVSPTMDATQEEGMTRGSVIAISASIVLAAILMVAFLFWDRHRKERSYKLTHAQDLLETMEFDNAGNAGDWRNPFGSLSQDESPSAAAAAAVVVASSSSQGLRDTTVNPIQSPSRQSRESYDTTQSTVVASTPPDSTALRTIPILSSMGGGVVDEDHHHHNSNSNNNKNDLNENGRPISGTNRSGGGTMRQNMFTTPQPHPRLDGRHVSVANTEITDLTYSEVGDRASDGAELFTLPPIYDEAYMIHHDNDDNPVRMSTNMDSEQDGVVPWSSLHIPQGEGYGTVDSGVGSMRPGMFDMGINQHHPSGFEMQVEELE